MSKLHPDQDILLQLARIEEKVDDLSGRHFFEYTGTSEKNWGTALSMARALTRNWTACDTSSGEIRPSFELEVQNALNRGCDYRRVYCGNTVSKVSNQPDRVWLSLMSLMQTNSDDGYHARLRKAILQGKLRVLHLNRPLDIDLFTIRRSPQEARALIGFATRHGIFDNEGFTSGLYSCNPAFANDLHDHFQQMIWKRAFDHVREQQVLKESGRQDFCQCVSFFDESLESLAPRARIP